MNPLKSFSNLSGRKRRTTNCVLASLPLPYLTGPAKGYRDVTRINCYSSQRNWTRMNGKLSNLARVRCQVRISPAYSALYSHPHLEHLSSPTFSGGDVYGVLLPFSIPARIIRKFPMALHHTQNRVEVVRIHKGYTGIGLWPNDVISRRRSSTITNQAWLL